jgi:hypothetical protein
VPTRGQLIEAFDFKGLAVGVRGLLISALSPVSANFEHEPTCDIAPPGKSTGSASVGQNLIPL